MRNAKTKQVAQALKALEVESSALLVGDSISEDVVRAARNIPKIRTLPVSLLNAVDLLNANKVVMTVGAVRKAEELWGRRLRPHQATARPRFSPMAELIMGLMKPVKGRKE